MKKYSFLVYHKDYEQFLHDIQELGVLHVIERESGEIENEELNDKLTELQNYNKIIQFLRKRNIGEIEAKKGNVDEILSLVIENQKNLELYQQKLASLNKDITVLEPWGEFNWDDIIKFKEEKLIFRFFVCSSRGLKPEWQSQYNIEIINNVGNTIYFVLIDQEGHETEIEAEEIKLPNSQLSILKNEMVKINKLIDKTEQHLDNMAKWFIPLLEEQREKLTENIDFNKVVLNTSQEVDNKLMVLEGWVPIENEQKLANQLEEKNIFFVVQQADVNEEPPILLKNNKFARLFEPIGELYTFPDYKELDLTPFFAPFFMMFFGFCLGDVGYGLIILLAAIFIRRKVKPSLKPILSLGIFLGTATIIMGTISGTLLGIDLTKLEYKWINDIQRVMLDYNKLMLLSLAVGFVQTIFGMALKAANKAKQFGFKHALSTIGWIFTILGLAVILALYKLKNVPFDNLKIPLIVVGAIGGFFIFFMNSPGKNIFLNFGLGIWDTYGTASGLLGDLLSYIRLFALGISSAVLGNVFNDLAFNLSPDIPVVGQVITIFILLFGHGLNLFMAALGSFVHPLRLTFVEFYKNAGFMGGGKKYKPFRKIVNN